MLRKLLSLASMSLLVSACATAGATTITYTASGSATGGDGPLSASAMFVTSTGQIVITLTNTLSPATIVNVGQSISDLSFTLSNAPGTMGTATASGQEGNISSTGAVTYISGTPGRFIGVGGGSYTESGNTVTLEAIGGSQPNELIFPFEANGTSYASTNPGIDSHNPYTIGPAVFTLALSGVTSSTTITAATFSFGTGPDTFLPGTPSTPPVPEPSSLVLMGSGITALAGVFRKRILATAMSRS